MQNTQLMQCDSRWATLATSHESVSTGFPSFDGDGWEQLGSLAFQSAEHGSMLRHAFPGRPQDR